MGLTELLGFPLRAQSTFKPPERLLAHLGGGFLLAYHNLSTKRFVEQIEAYQGLRLLSLSEMVGRVRKRRSTAGCYAITVDDGVRSTVEALSAVALARQWPVTFYLPTKYLDEPLSQIHMLWTNIRNRLSLRVTRLSSGIYELSDPDQRAKFVGMLTRRLYTKPLDDYEKEVRQLRDKMVAAGEATAEDLDPAPPVTWPEVALYSKSELLDFQSHGVTHRAVSALSAADLEGELRGSQEQIEHATGRPCRHFCYPFGGAESIGADAPRLVAKYYDSAVTMNRGRLKDKDPMLLPRIPIYEKDSAEVARLKVLTI